MKARTLLTAGDFFFCESDVWTVIHSTWQRVVIAENALGDQRSFKLENGRWKAVGSLTADSTHV